MKIIISILILISLVGTIIFYYRTGYIKKEGKIYYRHITSLSPKTELIEDCDAKTFKRINKYYAKDKKDVFYKYHLIKNANPLYFKQIEGLYYKDDKRVFHLQYEIKPVDSQTFEKIEENYFKDKNTVFYNGKEIFDANPSSFVVLKNNYGKDKNDVFYKREKLNVCSTENYELIFQDKTKHQWSRDGCFYYYEKNKIQVENYSKIEIIENSKFLKDDKYVYNWEGKVNYNQGVKQYEIDINTFYVDDKGRAKDKDGYFKLLKRRESYLNSLKSKK